MGEYERKFLGLLKYVGFIKDEKVKIQRFLSGMPSFYKDKIQYDETKSLIKASRKDKYPYDQAREENLCKSLGRIRRRINLIREGRDSNLLST